MSRRKTTPVPVLGTSGRIAILNRSEAAMRFIRAVGEYNRINGTSFEDVALLPPSDRGSLVARSATRVIFLPREGVHAYSLTEELVHLLEKHQIQGLWPGWGFLSENHMLAQALENAGIVFIGPGSDAMKRLGDKIESKRTAEQSGIPVIPWMPVEDSRLGSVARRIGFPLVVKASGGGGGRGIRVVSGKSGLEDAVRAVKQEAPGDVFAEKLIAEGRHVEVQVMADLHGIVRSFGTRDCSLQRRKQKVLEEAPCVGLPDQLHEQLEKWSRDLAAAVGYRNAGTVEFLVDGNGNPYFMEMNTRIQVEHTVTEESCDVDLVRTQIDVARGLELSPPEPGIRSHCVEARIYAEDPSDGFVPAPGRIRQLHFGQGPGIRVDCGVGIGEEITPHFDAMIAKIMGRGRTRTEALTRLGRALEETRILIDGGTTNIPFLRYLTQDAAVRSGELDINRIDRTLLQAYLEFPEELQNAAVCAAAVCEHRKRERENVVNFIARPVITGTVETSQLIHLGSGGGTFSAHVMRVGNREYLLKGSDGYTMVRWVDEGADEGLLEFDGCVYKIVSEQKASEWRLTVNGHFTVIRLVDHGVVRAPAPAIVTGIHVRVGDSVCRGDRLFTLEAMKMELLVTAGEAGVVEKVEVFPGSQVFAGGILMRFKSHGEEEAKKLSLPVMENFPSPEQALRLLEGVLLGYDVGSAEQESAARRFSSAQWEDFESLLPDLFQSVTRFAAVSVILSSQAGFRLEKPSVKLVSARTLVTDLIRRPGSSLDSIPSELRAALENLLPLYGFFQAEKGHLPHGMLFRLRRILNRAHQRRNACLSVLSLLFSFREQLREPPTALRNALKVLSVDADGNSRQTDLVETIRSTVYDIPERQKRTRGILRILRSFAKNGDAETDLDSIRKNIRHARWPELIPLHENAGRHAMNLFTWYFWGEMITGEEIWEDAPSPACAITVCFQKTTPSMRFSPQKRFFCMLRSGTWKQELTDLVPWLKRSGAASLEILLDRLDEGETSLCSFFNQLAEIPDEITLVDLSGTRTRVFRSPIGHAFVEDSGLCGLHPAQAARLELWRFSEFTLTRVECEDVILFNARARKCPDDERLIAMVEVFDPPVRMLPDGIRGFPTVSMAFRSACQAVRQQQSTRGKERRLHWNHLIMGVYPLPQLDAHETRAIAAELLPYTTRLGLEQVVVNTIIEGTRVDRHGFWSVRIRGRASEGISIDQGEQSSSLIHPIREEERLEIKARRRNIKSPETVLRILIRDAEGNATGKFLPYDVAVDPIQGRWFSFEAETTRPPGCGVMFGILSNRTASHPDGLERVVILSNPLHNMGSLAEPECRRLIAALDLAEEKDLSVLWIPISAGAHIDFESGTENLDWTARVLRRIVEVTERGRRIDILVSGVNVGAQSYFDAEATMTIHTKGFLVMTQEGSMVLTGKRALDFSGSVSAEDNLGIGGFERIMGPTGQAQALVRDISEGHQLLLHHADMVTRDKAGRQNVVPTADPDDRNICEYPYPVSLGHDFTRVGAIFSEESNPGRKKPFSVRPVMDAVRDSDSVWVERWTAMADGSEGVVVAETRIGGIPAGVVGIEAMGFPRIGQVPTDGPENWTPSTLFPRGSYKIARGLAAFSGQLPAVIFANLSGFDGSPESLRSWQLIHGAEIGRALVRFEGPVLLVVLSRYHGGAYVVFSTALNAGMEAVALSGSYASVIGGSAAAAVVFDSNITGEVEKHPKVVEIRKRLGTAVGGTRISLEAELEELKNEIKISLQQETAMRFDQVHSVERAARVGSLKTVIEPERLRSYIIGFLRRPPTMVGL